MRADVAQVRDLAPGLWVWSRRHPAWTPDHVRDVDLFVRRYGARAFGPWLFYPGAGLRRRADRAVRGAAGVGLPALPERALPAFALLELPFERVIVSHGDPVHDRPAYERALTQDSWRG